MTVFHTSQQMHKASVLALLLCKAGTCTWRWKHMSAGHFLSGTISPYSNTDDLTGWPAIKLAVWWLHSCGPLLWQVMLKTSRANQRLKRSSASFQCCWKVPRCIFLLSKKVHQGLPKSIPGGKPLTDQVVLKNMNKMATLRNPSWHSESQNS